MSQFPYQVAGPPKKPGIFYRIKKFLLFLSPFHNANRTAATITLLAVLVVTSLVGYGASRIVALTVEQVVKPIQIVSEAEQQAETLAAPDTRLHEDAGIATTPDEQSATPAAPPAANAPYQPTEESTENPVSTAPVKRSMKTAGALLSWDFNSSQLGVFTASRASETFNNTHGRITTYSVAAADSLFVEKDGGDGYLVKKMPKGSFNARSGSPLRHSMAINWKLNTPMTSGYFAYNFKTSPNFDSVKGGKIPGLCGGTCPSGGDQTTNAPRLADGGNNPAGKATGWSGRNMWQTGGHLIQYFYHPNQTTKYGPGYNYRYASGGRTYINDNKWHSIEHYVKMNTPGKTDGVFQAWFDGTRVLNLQNIRFRDDTSYAIDMLMFSVFFGGGDASFASTKDEYLYFDDFVLSRNPITH
jgi:hypothetical protein